MYKGQRILLVTVAHDEEVHVGGVLERVPRDVVDEVVLADDGSTDRTGDIARRAGARVVRLDPRGGVGRAARAALAAAPVQDFDVLVSVAANGKDSPEEIPRLLDPICEQGFDFVMGSRFLPGGSFAGDPPLHRRLGTRLHPALVGLFCCARITESTNGFRALRTAVLRDERIDLEQAWLDRYELEVYLLVKILRLGYRATEVPCTKRYAPRGESQTRMTPLVDWWRMLRPVFLLGLGLRR